MRPTRRVILALALGAVTTVAVAWSGALIPGSPQGAGSAMIIDHFAARPMRAIAAAPLVVPPLAVPSPLATPEVSSPNDAGRPRQLYFQVEGTDTRRWVQFSVSYNAKNSIGPAWDPLQGPSHYPEAWRLVATDKDAILDAMACFPNARGVPLEQPRSNAPWPSWPEWPGWLPAIPSTPNGLVGYGARASGWPLLSMRSTCTLDDVNASLAWHRAWQVLPHANYPPSSRDPAMGTAPLAPIPLPFAVDTLAFGVPWWVLLGGHRDIRRCWRRRHRLCEHCGYSTAGLAQGTPCPECGMSSAQSPDSKIDRSLRPPSASA